MLTRWLAPYFVAAAGFWAPAMAQESPSDPQLAQRVADLLIQRCADCHRPDSEEPKAIKAWEDAADLESTLAHESLVVPGDPIASDLYLSIEFDDMPPADTDGGPLTDEEKKWIADWIEAGAAMPAADAAPSPEDPGSEPELEDPAQTTAGPSAPSEGNSPEGQADSTNALPSSGRQPKTQGWMNARWPKYLGRFHPIAVHFPIALLTLAAVAELLGRWRKEPHHLQTAWFLLAIGTLSAIPASVLGWIHAENTSHQGDDLFWHRWLGIAVTVLACVTLAFGRRAPKWRLPALLLLAFLVGITGHYGGYLSFGRDWLSWPG